MAGEFLLKYFESKQDINVKPNNEVDVLCPFPHDKGYEQRPSAHFNVETGVFHCKTCSAEGRFSNGGLSEASFVSLVYGTSYTQSIKLISQLNAQIETDETWGRAVELLQANQTHLDYLEQRGITLDIVKEYQLGSLGDGIVYPVFVNGVILDKRTYTPDPEPGFPKIKSVSGASPLLFPFDHWLSKVDSEPTLLCAGENDTLLARKHGFNAVTSTFGEGSFPQMFLGLFTGKTVYIAYDCDEAGRKGALKVAFLLKEAGALVYIVDLGLDGTKEDKDITDFFMKRGFTAADLQQKLDEATVYTGEMFQEAKNEYYPLVNLWDVHHGEYSGRRISSRVNMMGKYDKPLETPTAVEWECHNPNLESEGSPCHTCNLKGKAGWWTLDEDNLHQLLHLVEVDEFTQNKKLNQFIGVPSKCPGIKKTRREKKAVQKVIFAPDVETEDILSGFKLVEHYSYTLGLDLEDGHRYRIYMKRFPHPKDQSIVSVVDRVEDSDSGINQFKIEPSMIQQLSQLQGSPDEVMEKRFELAKTVVGNFALKSVVESVFIMYHSVLDFKLAGKLVDKGYPEGLVIGASRTGKSDTAKRLLKFLRIGNMTAVKGATVAGLMGGADKLPSGGHRIRWGTIPRNNEGLLILDEMSGIPQNVLSALTDMRSSGLASIEKIVSGKAPAKTRMLWISNQRSQMDGNSRPIMMYSNGVDVVRELVGTNEDIARFDFIVLEPETDKPTSPFRDNEDESMSDIDSSPYRNLVYWAWTRSAEQVKFDFNIERYMWQRSQELNDKYYTQGLNLFGNELFKKLARIAVACAGFCFSHDGTGESILVMKEHVDWAVNFLIRCYDNPVFRIGSFVENERKLSTTNDEIITLTVSLLKKYPMIVKLLLDQDIVPIYNLKTAGGISDEEFKHISNQMYTNGLIQISKNGFAATRRLRISINAIQNRGKVEKPVDNSTPRSFFDQIDLQ